MQIAADVTTPQSIPGTTTLADLSTAVQPEFSQYRIIRRNGAVVGFEPGKISVAVTKAFLAVEGGQSAASARIRELVAALTGAVVSALVRRQPAGGTFHIEDVQDQVELALMRSGEHEAARAYVLYREKRAEARAHEAAQKKPAPQPQLHTVEDGVRRPLDLARLEELIASACEGLGEVVDPKLILAETLKNIYDGVPADEVRKSAVLAARALIEKDPGYSYVTARLLLHAIRFEVLGDEASHADMAARYAVYFPQFIERGIAAELLDPELARFDLNKLGKALKAERDLKFGYLGLQTLYDRYFLHERGRRIELPQAFFMRVAMGLALKERNRDARAIEFYDVLSSFDFMSSTPTLFNSGTLRSQLSSCYLTTVSDDLDGIYEAIKENALLAKYAGGLGNDWTPVRALGSHIKGTNGKSQGVVPFLKVVSDTAVAVNQCFAPETGVYTAEGVKAIKDVKPGELVLGKSGTYREVTQRLAYNQTAAMVSIKVRHAVDPLLVTAGHPFYAIRGMPSEQAEERTLEWIEKGKLEPRWVDAGELRSGDYLAQVIPAEVVNVAGFTEEDARLYGAMLASAEISRMTIGARVA